MLDLNQARDAHIDQRLRKEPIIWLSSTRPNGRPHLVPVWFLWENSSILIFSQPNTQKVRNLRHNPAVMLALEAANEGGDIVLLVGQAELLSEPVTEMPSPYEQKYAESIKGLGMNPEQMIEAYSQAIRITPTKFVQWS